MKTLHFKTTFYKAYAPFLFKCKKIYAKSLATLWKLSPQQTLQLINYCWDRYLTNKFYLEIPYYPGNKIPLNNIKRNSDTIFILGCGASINEVTDQEWEIISKHDSIGVNYFFSHHFRPTYHMIELGQSKKSMDCLNNHLLRKKERKNELIFLNLRHLLRRENINLDNSNNNLYLYSPSVPKSTSLHLVKRIVKRWFTKPNTLIHHASNLDCTVHFSYQAGYKNIYLLGVDLDKNQYFWDIEDSKKSALKDVKEAAKDDYRISNFNSDPESMHATVDISKTRAVNSLTIIEYLKIINEFIFKKNNINFANCNPKSLLREHFDFIDIKSLDH